MSVLPAFKFPEIGGAVRALSADLNRYSESLTDTSNFSMGSITSHVAYCLFHKCKSRKPPTTQIVSVLLDQMQVRPTSFKDPVLLLCSMTQPL